MDAANDFLLELKKIFELNSSKYGPLEKPTQQGLIEIARNKAATWNQWRKAFPRAHADFRGVDFTDGDYSTIDFSEFEFPDAIGHSCVSFDGAIFPRGMAFSNAKFGLNASFYDATFEGKVYFYGTSFAPGANFSLTKFKEAAIFKDADFGEFSSFASATFGISTAFVNVKFGNHANFMASKFGYETKFIKTNLGSSCCFFNASFDESAEFSECDFGQKSDFRNSTFNDQSLFLSTSFGKFSNFSESQFGDAASFDKCSFSDHTYFIEANFGNSTRIVDCNFGNDLSFFGATFKDNTKIHRNTSGMETDFSQSAFNGKSDFSESRYGEHAIFQNIALLGPSNFNNIIFDGACDFSYSRQPKHPQEKINATPFSKYLETHAVSDQKTSDHAEISEFQAISFCGSSFGGDAIFTGRKFTSTANFGPCTKADIPNSKQKETSFLGAAEFHGCSFSQDTSFKNTNFRSEQSEKYVLAFRTLKGLMRELNATQEEQLFFRLEIEAEQSKQSKGRKILYRLYEVTSFYGVSIARPICTLLFFMVVFGAAYGLLADHYATHANPISGESRTWQWLRYTTINTFPIPGFDKTLLGLREALFGDGEEYGWHLTLAIALEMIHKLISFGCAFLLGLALRNLFKMKS